MTVGIVLGIIAYVFCALSMWRHLAYRIAKNEARSHPPGIGEMAWGMFMGLLLSVVWPFIFIGWWFRKEPLLFRTHRDGREYRE